MIRILNQINLLKEKYLLYKSPIIDSKRTLRAVEFKMKKLLLKKNMKAK